MWEKLVSVLGGNLLSGVTDLVKAFKLPPEQQIAFEAKMAEIEANVRTTLEKIAADDRASARQRETATNDTTPRILAYGITVGFFGVLAYMLGDPLPPNSQTHDVLLVMLGSLGTAWTGIVAYYFGSSAGSAAKTWIMNHKEKG